MAEMGAMKELVADMAKKMYSDAYVKRYRPFIPLLTILQKPKNVRRFVILAKACLTCNTYKVLDKIKCPVFVLGADRIKLLLVWLPRKSQRNLDVKYICMIA